MIRPHGTAGRLRVVKDVALVVSASGLRIYEEA